MNKWYDDLDYAKNLIESGKTYKEISILLNRSYKSVRCKLNKEGFFYNSYKSENNKYCLNCNEEFKYSDKKQKFCSSSCSATYNNKLRKSENEKKNCLNCDSLISGSGNKYCSKKCQQEYLFKYRINKWLNGELNGNKGKYGTSNWIKKYLIQQHGEKCMECGWNERNIVTGNIPIELEHIDGDSENNNIDNLKILCPNCHSLTPTYKSLNKGRGRHKRLQRYKNGESF